MLKRLWRDTRPVDSTAGKSDGDDCETHQNSVVYKSFPIIEGLKKYSLIDEETVSSSGSFVLSNGPDVAASNSQPSEESSIGCLNNEHMHGEKVNVKVSWFRKLLQINRKLSFSRRSIKVSSALSLKLLGLFSLFALT